MRTVETTKGIRTLESWFRSKYKRPHEGKTWEDVTHGDALKDYYYELAFELQGLKEITDPTSSDMERITKLERALSDEEPSDGPTGDPWLDEFMAGEDDEDDDYYEWKNDVDA
jgi:hypothetical protein